MNAKLEERLYAFSDNATTTLALDNWVYSAPTHQINVIKTLIPNFERYILWKWRTAQHLSTWKYLSMYIYPKCVTIMIAHTCA